MPTFKFYKNGKEISADMLEGANEEKLRELLKKHNEWGTDLDQIINVDVRNTPKCF